MNEMTMRKYHEAVLAIPGVPADVAEKARAELEKLNAKNANRTSKPSKKQEANAPIKAAILAYMGTLSEGVFANELEGNVEGVTSTSHASSLLRQLEDAGLVVKSEKKNPATKVKSKFYELVGAVAEE